jgi:ribosomal protein S27AE
MDHNLEKLTDSELERPRCGTLMKDGGPLSLRTQADAFPQARLPAHIHANIVEFSTYVCPACGKVEFFL